MIVKMLNAEKARWSICINFVHSQFCQGGSNGVIAIELGWVHCIHSLLCVMWCSMWCSMFNVMMSERTDGDRWSTVRCVCVERRCVLVSNFSAVFLWSEITFVQVPRGTYFTWPFQVPRDTYFTYNTRSHFVDVTVSVTLLRGTKIRNTKHNPCRYGIK